WPLSVNLSRSYLVQDWLPFYYINSLTIVDTQNIIIRAATPDDKVYAKTITDEMESSAKARGTGIAKRSPEYLEQKIDEGKAVIAFSSDMVWAGFCYIETWSHDNYVANSGLIVSPQFRKSGLAKAIKQKIFE